MGSGGVAIAALPTVICLKVPFSDGLGVGWGVGDRCPWSLVNGDGVVVGGEVIIGETTLQC